MQHYAKMKGAGYVIRGTPWQCDVEEITEAIGQESLYKPTIR